MAATRHTMRELLIIPILFASQTHAFGYHSNDNVKDQVNHCMTPVNACKVICIYGDGHKPEEQSPAVESLVKVMSGSLKPNFCEQCNESRDTWETRMSLQII